MSLVRLFSPRAVLAATGRAPSRRYLDALVIVPGLEWQLHIGSLCRGVDRMPR